MEDKTCSTCGLTKPLDEFYSRTKPDGSIRHGGQCRDCIRAARKRWYVANRDTVIAKQHEFYRANRDQEIARMRTQAIRRRDAVLSAYGGRCACCGEARRIFLTIDHVNGDGAEHRRQLGRSSPSRIIRWLCENDYPSGFQVLCWNCNHAKYLNGGICPHQQDDPGDFVAPEPLPVACPDCSYKSSAYGVAVHRGKVHQEKWLRDDLSVPRRCNPRSHWKPRRDADTPWCRADRQTESRVACGRNAPHR